MEQEVWGSREITRRNKYITSMRDRRKYKKIKESNKNIIKIMSANQLRLPKSLSKAVVCRRHYLRFR